VRILVAQPAQITPLTALQVASGELLPHEIRDRLHQTGHSVHARFGRALANRRADTPFRR
jgi:hypothetical protein